MDFSTAFDMVHTDPSRVTANKYSQMNYQSAQLYHAVCQGKRATENKYRAKMVTHMRTEEQKRVCKRNNPEHRLLEP